MDSDCELKLNTELRTEPSLASFEELYSTMEELNSRPTDHQEESRPPSTVSLSSWTFSPITSLDESDAKPSLSLVTEADDSAKTRASGASDNVNPVSANTTPESNNNGDINESDELCAAPCESYFPPPSQTGQPNQPPIQNYITNYCISPTWQDLYTWNPSWQEIYSWNTPTDYSVINQSPQIAGAPNCNQTAGFVQAEYTKQPMEPVDPLSTLNTHGLEFTRCSTPEYIMALNSLNQADSMIDGGTNLDITVESMNSNSYYNQTTFQEPHGSKFLKSQPKIIDPVHHDSGYSSDLNSSPVIGYQDNTMKQRQGNLGKMVRDRVHTSTPQNYPILRLASFNHNRENIPPNPRRLVSNRIAMSGFMMKPSANIKPGLPRQVLTNLPNEPLPLKQCSVGPTQIQSSSVTSTNLAKLFKPKFQTVADFEESKRNAKAALKRKAEMKLKNNDGNASEDSVKRRRHNEPLDLHAVEVMTNWYESHKSNPYPTKSEKEKLAKAGGITLAQVKSWFANKRNRSNNTRPKKQKQVMADKLLDICHQLARDAQHPEKDNAYYIQQLSGIIGSSSANQ